MAEHKEEERDRGTEIRSERAKERQRERERKRGNRSYLIHHGLAAKDCMQFPLLRMKRMSSFPKMGRELHKFFGQVSSCSRQEHSEFLQNEPRNAKTPCSSILIFCLFPPLEGDQ